MLIPLLPVSPNIVLVVANFGKLKRAEIDWVGVAEGLEGCGSWAFFELNLKDCVIECVTRRNS